MGLWRVVGATHKTTNKDVSVWMFDKRVVDGVKGSAGRNAGEAKEWVIDQMKKEVSSFERCSLYTGNESISTPTSRSITYG